MAFDFVSLAIDLTSKGGARGGWNSELGPARTCSILWGVSSAPTDADTSGFAAIFVEIRRWKKTREARGPVGGDASRTEHQDHLPEMSAGYVRCGRGGTEG